MRHGNKVNALGRKYGHRQSLLSNLAVALVTHKRIRTTSAKAKALRSFVEPIINRSKTNTTHSRRMAFRYLQDKTAVAELFDGIAAKVAARPGGYTRILKIGTRPGDAAEMVYIELVDYNEGMQKDAKKKVRRSSRRSRKGGAAAEGSDAGAAEAKSASGKAPKAAKATAAPKEAPKGEDAPDADGNAADGNAADSAAADSAE
jgi:large subunit ribosomal protein L17